MNLKTSLYVIVALFFFISLVRADDLDIIRQVIEEQNADWLAQENPISVLPDAELKHIMGVLLPPVNMEHYEIGEASATLPSEWDWRDRNGINWVTPIKEQGSCGSCWAFGTVAQLESAIMIAKLGPDPSLDLSEQYMVSCNTSNLGCNGGYMVRAYNFLVSSGVPFEVCFPYKAKDLPCSDACRNPVLATIDHWYSIPRTIADLQEAVYLQPITVAFYVYRDFTYYKSGIYKYVYGDLIGGHAVCVVGWSTKDKCFIVKNSWGTSWGEKGYFRIAMSEMSSIVRFGIEAGRFEIPPSLVSYKTLIGTWSELKK